MAGTLKALEELGDAFERRARTDASRRWPRRRPVLAAAGASGALLTTAVALAATGWLTGAPVQNPKRAQIPVRTSDLLPLRVRDPDAGPPWGLRQVVARDGRGCVQIGRVVAGRLGFLGRDGTFGDDGRFHELSPEASGDAYCGRTDAAGHTFASVFYRGLPASGNSRSCTPQAQRDLARTSPPPHRPDPLPLCPARDLRMVAYGLLGPAARSVTYREPDGTLVTRPVSGADGGYLIIRRVRPADHADGSYTPTGSPIFPSGVLSVQYRDGAQCRLRSDLHPAGVRVCRARGFTAAAELVPRRSDLRTPVRVQVRRRRLHGTFTREVTVAFRAHRTTRDGAFYFVTQDPPSGPSASCNGSSEAPVVRRVLAGERVSARTFVDLACHGVLTGTVAYQPAPDRPSDGLFEPDERAVVFARYRVRLRRR